MNELQAVFVFETLLSFVVIASISVLAFGKGRLWVVGQPSFLASGGIYAWASENWSTGTSVLIALLIFFIAALFLSLAAALLEGDRFVVVSLGWAYVTYAVFFAKFGDAVRGIRGVETSEARFMILGLLLILAIVVGIYAVGLKRSPINTVLLLARDYPPSLESSGLSVRPLRFWIHLISTLPVGLAGILIVMFYHTYSPAVHGASRCLLLFVVGIPFGINSLRGSMAAAICLTALTRAVDLGLSSEAATHFYRWVADRSNAADWATASNLSAPLTQLISS